MARKVNNIYLDSNILVAFYSKDKEEVTKKAIVNSALNVINKLAKVQLHTSLWTIAELIHVLIRQGMERGDVWEIESRLINEKRLKGVKLHFVDVSPKKDYDFNEFFYHIREALLKYQSGGVKDIIHSIIMKNNDIEAILTFDEKGDFKQIPDLIVLHPKKFEKINI